MNNRTDRKSGRTEVTLETIKDAAADTFNMAPELFRELQPCFSFEELWEKRLGGEEQEGRSNLFRKWRIGLAAMAVAFVMVIGSSFLYPSFGEALRHISFIDLLYEKGRFLSGLEQIEKKNLSSRGDASVTDHGIEFRIDNVFYDGIQLVLNYEVNFPPDGPKITDKNAAVYYKLNFAEKQADYNSIYTHEFTITGDHSFAGTTLFSFGGSELPDTLHLSMLIDRIGTQKGNWDVSIPLNKSKSDALAQTFYPGIKAAYQGTAFTVKKLVLAPAAVRLVLQAEDNFSMSKWSIQLQDDLGTYLDSGGGSGSENGQSISDYSSLTDINPHPAYLTLVIWAPNYSANPEPPKEVVTEVKHTFPIHVHREGGEDITITNIDYRPSETRVYYTLSTEMEQNLPFHFRTPSKEFISYRHFPVRTARDKLSFMAVFPPLDPKNGLEMVTHADPAGKDAEPLRVKIPLNW
ncbi:protein of unknown function [Paenibacillus sophorae]|uniref:DUF4179 domain-containing protein n=1 Tax=Paenibacillus sophorae TaxID=1333845 RepID=A0A1H8FRG8_9BACL|nr:DUF4179 domain-containing protein [Paenibacillus sophorae]QWU13951.1 DUF4179 domain-containing protein [Paenibacillus sophorae]SEN34124.1 protein of unknown function [Paenibacillus sophorae]